MFSKFNKQLETVFLDLHSKNFTVDEAAKVNVILSPSLYWVKKISLPVKNVREARTLLPSLFEDTLSDGVYSYSTYKVEDDFYIFAYDDKHILETLSAKGINPAQVASVYFAQSELYTLSEAKKIDEQNSVCVRDDIVVLLPNIWFENSTDLDISDIELSKHTLQLKQFTHIVNAKSFTMLVSVFGILIILLGVEYFIVNDKLQKTLESKDEIFVKNGLKPTMMQNTSMLKSYKKTHQKQTQIRECIGEILSLKLQNTERLTSLKLKGDTLSVTISGIKNAREKSIVKFLSDKKLYFKPTFQNETLSMEIDL